MATESHLLNADKINSGDIKDLNKLGVTAKGNQVTFKLTSPCPQFKYYLAFSNFMPQKQSYVEKVGKDYGTTSKIKFTQVLTLLRIGMVQMVNLN